jgi:hypothetical protein
MMAALEENKWLINNTRSLFHRPERRNLPANRTQNIEGFIALAPKNSARDVT